MASAEAGHSRGVIWAAIVTGVFAVIAAYVGGMKAQTGDEAAARRQTEQLGVRVKELEAENHNLRSAIAAVREAAANFDANNKQQADAASKQQSEAAARQQKEVAAYRTRIAELESDNTALRKAAVAMSPANVPPNATDVAPKLPAPSSGQAAKAKRTELVLPPERPVRVADDVTVTAVKYSQPFGLTVMVNGTKRTYQRAGDRIKVKEGRGESCFLEVMSLPSQPSPPSAEPIRVDYVCPPGT